MSLEISKDERIHVIDVLRGFSLLGIVMVHMVEQYYAGPMPQSVMDAHPGSLADKIVFGFVGLFIIGKFYMIFSFLFGLSFSIQSSRGNSDGSFLLRFVWRLLLLFLIGMIHHVHYRGDILGIYAMLGLGLLLFFRVSDKLLLIAGLVLVFNIPSLFMRIGGGLLNGNAELFPSQDPVKVMSYYETVKSGAYLDILRMNLLDFPAKMAFQIFSGRIFITLGLFLLGYYAGRKKLFSSLLEKINWIRKLLSYSWKTLVVSIVFAATFFGGAYLLKLQLPEFLQIAVGGFVYDILNASMAMIYVCGIILLFQKEKWKSRLMNFYQVGRMGLTTYLVQSLFGFFIFFNPGVGLLNELGAAICLGLAIGIFILQILFSKVWFQYFNYGMFEWVWRSLTYFKWQPLRRRTELAVAN
jgi:uncharacterized protein